MLTLPVLLSSCPSILPAICAKNVCREAPSSSKAGPNFQSSPCTDSHSCNLLCQSSVSEHLLLVRTTQPSGTSQAVRTSRAARHGRRAVASRVRRLTSCEHRAMLSSCSAKLSSSAPLAWPSTTKTKTMHVLSASFRLLQQGSSCTKGATTENDILTSSGALSALLWLDQLRRLILRRPWGLEMEERGEAGLHGLPTLPWLPLLAYVGGREPRLPLELMCLRRLNSTKQLSACCHEAFVEERAISLCSPRGPPSSAASGADGPAATHSATRRPSMPEHSRK
mmetsp:Transcript_52431/g.162783  ORF Transcript_52431/g.162783 Transcript_52431/m.162783 type:complete len:281 (+) Transcript_52431:198-1040(+)